MAILLDILRELFPAHAGVILYTRACVRVYVPFPRTRGGDPKKVGGAKYSYHFSPHTRG